MQDETIKTIVWGVCIFAGIMQFGTYCLIALIVTGRRAFERRPEQQPLQEQPASHLGIARR